MSLNVAARTEGVPLSGHDNDTDPVIPAGFRQVFAPKPDHLRAEGILYLRPVKGDSGTMVLNGIQHRVFIHDLFLRLQRFTISSTGWLVSSAIFGE
jgi:hypothetical protein